MSYYAAHTATRPLDGSAATLAQNIAKLSAKDQEFASSLLSSARSRGASAKQQHWIDVLAERATAKPAEGAKVMESLAALVELFDRASQSLKRPFILIDGGQEVGTLRLKLAGAQSRNAGQIYVSRNTDDYAYLGRIDEGGAFHASRGCRDLLDRVVEALTEMAKDPAGAAKAYGQKFGNCCFCARELTHKGSLLSGYGPVCADKFGLPWGVCEEVA